jgi:hypothetical protein
MTEIARISCSAAISAISRQARDFTSDTPAGGAGDGRLILGWIARRRGEESL